MGNAFLAEKKLSFIVKLFNFVCEKRLLNWLQVMLLRGLKAFVKLWMWFQVQNFYNTLILRL
jgi:hypothetical protein